jgi:hypothetical protein
MIATQLPDATHAAHVSAVPPHFPVAVNLRPTGARPNAGHSHWQTGRTRVAQRDWVGAARAFARATEATPGDALYWVNLANAERNAGAPERAGAAMLVAVTVGLLLVTASGIVGVASLWVSQRRKQIGVLWCAGFTLTSSVCRRRRSRWRHS